MTRSTACCAANSSARVVVGLLVAKALVWSIALGSGTSGGVLAPLLIMGGALGAFVGSCIPVGDPGLWALIGMAAMMGGTMRSPLTAMVFAVELTRDFNLFPALLIGSVAALGVTVLLMRRSILTEKLARRGHHITREYSIDPFELARVREVMDTDVPTVPATMKLSELSDRIAQGDPDLSRRQGTLIVDERNRLVGIITRGDIVRALRQNQAAEMTVAEAGSTELAVAFPDEPLARRAHENAEPRHRAPAGRGAQITRPASSVTSDGRRCSRPGCASTRRKIFASEIDC